jgi:UDP-glucose 4-epimerase
MLPLVPPWGTAFAAAQARRLGLRIPVELIHQLRYGRGLDNRRLKASGYAFRYTTREALLKLRAQQRLRPLLRSGADSYRYEREVEDFLRWSPSVQEARAGASADGDGALESALKGYDELTVDELVGAIASMDTEGLSRLRGYEAAHRARPDVLQALDRRLKRPGFGGGAS